MGFVLETRGVRLLTHGIVMLTAAIITAHGVERDREILIVSF